MSTRTKLPKFFTRESAREFRRMKSVMQTEGIWREAYHTHLVLYIWNWQAWHTATAQIAQAQSEINPVAPHLPGLGPDAPAQPPPYVVAQQRYAEKMLRWLDKDMNFTVSDHARKTSTVQHEVTLTQAAAGADVLSLLETRNPLWRKGIFLTGAGEFDETSYRFWLQLSNANSPVEIPGDEYLEHHRALSEDYARKQHQSETKKDRNGAD